MPTQTTTPEARDSDAPAQEKDSSSSGGGSSNTPPTAGRRMQNPRRRIAKGAARGAVAGAAKEGGKQAAIEGAKGAARGAARGARAGAAAGSVIPVVGTAIGGTLGGLIGGAAGGAAGAAKGGAKGAIRGGQQGARKGAARAAARTQKPQSVGVNAAGINSAAERLSERGAEMVGKRFGGSMGGAITKKVMHTFNKALKKAVPSEKARLVLRAAGGLGPGGIAAIIVVILILVLIIIIMGDPAGAGEQKLKIIKSGPTEATNGEELEYKIAVTFPDQASDIVITDRIPDGTDYIDSSPSAKFDPATRTATWNLKDYQVPPGLVLSDVNTTLLIRLRATADNAFLVNMAEGSLTPYSAPPVGGDNGPIADGFVPAQPHSNDCNGKYDFSQWPDENPLGNYGDPQCNFSKDNLYNHLKAKEPNPEFVNIWFDMVVPVESGFSPNAFASPKDPVQCSLDCSGAWGLYQMGSSKPPGQSPPAPGKNGELDRGDVNWEIQTTMAIGYNRELLSCNFRYWASARSIWGKYSC
jgi:uncharacterized repeat protein (TIGR01451 family)